MSATLEVCRSWTPGEQVRVVIDGAPCAMTFDQAARKARALYAEARNRKSELLAARLKLGQFLLQVRAEAVRRGVWRYWLDSCGVHLRTAQKAMQMASGDVGNSASLRDAEIAVGIRTEPTTKTNNGALRVRDVAPVVIPVVHADARGLEIENEETYRTESSVKTNTGALGVRVDGSDGSHWSDGSNGRKITERGASGVQHTLDSIWDLAEQARELADEVCEIADDDAGVEEEVRELFASFVDELGKIKAKAVAA